jgi:hypothetical protein
MNSIADNSTASQRSRILQRLQSGRTLTTLEARHQLDICHPGMRVCELRKQGYRIVTTMVEDVTAEGCLHLVGRYTLLPRRQLTLHDFLTQKKDPETAATDSGSRQNKNLYTEGNLSAHPDQADSRGGGHV